MLLKYIIIGVIATHLASCHKQSVPNKVFVSSIEKFDCKQPDSILDFYTYYQGEKIDFEYTPIALISVIKGTTKDSVDLKSILKYNAVMNCADAIINLNQSYDQGTYKKTNYLYNEYSSYHIQNMQFDMLSFHGLAVKLKSTSGLRKDKIFIKEYPRLVYEEKENSEYLIMHKKNQGATIAGLIAFLVVGVLFYITVRP
jgi:hypothetical protein